MRLDKQIGISYRQLDFWTRKGYVHGEADGSGYARTFTDFEKGVAQLMGLLVRVGGLQPKFAAKYAREMLTTGKRGIKLGDSLSIIVAEATWDDLLAVRADPELDTSTDGQVA